MAALFGGVMANTFGRKKVILANHAMGVAGFIIPAFSNQPWVILLGRFIQGPAISTVTTQVSAQT
jgi:MFS family permease